ncbi:protein mini spindles isoform X3 [Bradysia coprophila]|uniref:protein mini spindles isoform X3 n=1 Tax=Bradysia coprophila TaxID=38358 RepID=UPI00187DC23A|nr:protein mini spindles isoform X3 [Bradysia coprophila]
MEEDTEFQKLPVDERCAHKLWKARLHGYQEAIKIFSEIDDEKSTEWNKFHGLIKKFVTDSHAMAQERGLEATLIYVENCGHAGKIVGDVMAGLVLKCIAAPKAKTKDLATQIALMFIEIEKQDIALEELVKGMEQKNPKIVAGSTAIVSLALNKFGNKVIAIKPLLKQIPVLLADRDKNVRDEGKALIVEIFRWIGPALKPHLSSVPAVVQTELETEFEKVKSDKAEPSRYLRSQQMKKVAADSASNDNEDVEADGDDANEPAADIDPMDLIDPVDILSKLPKDFYDKLEEKKWQLRKESLEALEVLLQNPKLANGDYGDVVKALRKVIAKDSNVVLVALAGKSLAALARGLNKKFSIYAPACVPTVLEKFKEKKANVVTALRDCMDAMYPSLTLENIQEDLLEALNNKNPSIKTETCLFLARAFSRTLPSIFNKKLLKTFVVVLLKTLNESDPAVRDASAETLGTLMKLLGEKTVAPHLADVDPLKLAKIKECAEKAVIVVKVPAAPKTRPVTAPSGPSKPAAKEAAKPVARPSTAVAKKPAPVKKAVSSGGGSSSARVAKSASSTKICPAERELTPEEVDERAADLLPGNILAELGDANWKTRLSSSETFLSTVSGLESCPSISQVLIRIICKKPGLKESNFQVLKLKLEIIKKIVEVFGISTTTGDMVLNDVVEKLGDAKNSATAAECLLAIADAINLEYMIVKMLSYSFEQKSPKVQMEALQLTGEAIQAFGLQVQPKKLIDFMKKALQSVNATVRQATITTLGIIYLYTGDSLMMFFDGEKNTIKQQIQAEFQKNASQKPPKPTRGVKVNSEDDDFDEKNEHEDTFEAEPVDLSEMIPRVDISGSITEALLTEISDKNWKTRNEGLTKLQGIIGDAKRIHPTLGELPQALAQRLVDSNAKIAQTSLSISQQLAEAMGPACSKHVRVLFPGFLSCLGDSKPFVRAASMTCINVWCDQAGYKEFFEGEMIVEALKTGTPALKTELWNWLAEKLPKVPAKIISKDELLTCLPLLYLNICDRSPDVRKNANEAILGFMIHLGYETMIKALERQKPSAKKDILAALDKVRPNLPVKPLPKSKQQAPIVSEEPKAVKGKATKPAAAAKNAPAAARKKEEEVDTSPLLAVNNLKNQRLLDEQKLKVLKWTFTTPREEFTDLLKDQMSTASVNKSLMANMFHEDFRYHLKAIDSLIEDRESNSKALVCNLDLILKWISLRFYDTNPSVLLKGLDYLTAVFQMLADSEYVMAENEGSCFLPHLLIKIGDPKDAVRNGVRGIFRQICVVYPFTKVFSYIMEGLKSKNARQRTECLDELGSLIEIYGMSACHPTPQVALKEIARHISDRDNSVRSAALNCVVQAYFLTGDKVYKLIGNLNEKDLSMLDERIKRASKTRKPTAESPKMNATVVLPTPEPEPVDDVPEALPEIPIQHESPTDTRTTPDHSQLRLKAPEVFGFNADVIRDIEKDWIGYYSGVRYPADKLQSVISQSRSTTTTNTSHGRSFDAGLGASPSRPSTAPTQNNLADVLPKEDPNLIRIIRSIASPDSIQARAALNELNDILDCPEKQAALRNYEDMYVDSILAQFKILSQLPLSESLVMYQPILSSSYSFFSSHVLGKNIGVESLKKMLAMLLGLLADNKLSASGDEGQYTKVINGVCLRVLDRSNFTNLNCAMIRLLKETCSGGSLPKFTDLIMKCIWRNVKVMPDKSDEIDYELVLLEIHGFMSALPQSWWNNRPSDTPIRTVKTIIHNIAKLKGRDILLHTGKIPQSSELYTYLLKALKTVHKDHASNDKGPQNSLNAAIKERQISKQTHESMSQIFKLISDKDTSKEGVARLYEFKKQNPDVDIAPLLKGSSPVFKKFIEESLQSYEQANANRENDSKENNVTAGKTDCDYYMSRLNQLLNKNKQVNDRYGIDNDMNSATVKMAAQNNNVAAPEFRTEREPVHVVKCAANETTSSSNRLDLIQQRLALIRENRQN